MAQGGLKVKAKNKSAAKAKSTKAGKVSKVNRNKVIAPKKVKAQEAAKVKKAIANRYVIGLETNIQVKSSSICSNLEQDQLEHRDRAGCEGQAVRGGQGVQARAGRNFPSNGN